MCILGDLFVGALKGIAPVLVAVLVASAIAKSGSGLSSRFNTVITLYLFTTLLAAIFAVLASHFFPVGISVDNVASVEGAAPGALDEVFRKILKDITSNPLAAIANANYLSILFWAVVIGLALKIVASERTIASLGEWADAVSKVVGWIIQCAPFGIMGLVYTSVSASGLEIFTTYGQLLLLLVGCMLTVSLVVNPIIVGLLLRRNPYPLVWRCLKESGVSAFFTRSSAANIPVNMELCKRMGLDKDFYSVSIPLGSIINMNGAAATITVMTLATCHALGIDITLGSSLLLSTIAALGACGTSGVAGGSLLLIPMACSLFGISNDIAMQTVAVGFIIGVVQDSVETALNSSGDVLFTIAAEMRERMKRGK
jgi:serine/threonine transporter